MHSNVTYELGICLIMIIGGGLYLFVFSIFVIFLRKVPGVTSQPLEICKIHSENTDLLAHFTQTEHGHLSIVIQTKHRLFLNKIDHISEILEY